MSNTTTDHVVRLSADFSDFVREAKKAGDKSSSIMSKALEAGIKKRSFIGYMHGLKNFEKKRAQLEKKFHALSYAQEAQNAGKVGRKLQEVQEKIAELTRDLNSETLAQDVKARKTAERNLFKEKSKLLRQLADGEMEGFSNALKEANKELEAITSEQLKAAKALDRTTEQVARGAERAAEFMKMFRRDAIKGADEFNERLEGSISNLRSGLQNINIGEMLSGGGAGISKGIGSLAEMAKGLGAVGGALGAMAVGLGAVLTVLGPLVLLAGAFAAVMLEMDSEVKEFNNSAVNTFGTRSIMNVGMGSMRENLTVLRHATQDLNKTLGLTQDEALGVFDAFDAGGITMKRLTQGTLDAAAAERRLGDVLQRTAGTARALGVGVGEFATTLADYTDTLAFSLESVTGQFAMVSKQAQDAGFSTRRFYSLITQATAGQASLNTHLDTTAELLVRISKTLGEKQAAEVLGGAAGGFQDTSTQDRYRTIMTTGAGRTKKAITGSAEREASTLVDDMSKSLASPEFGRAIATASASGVTLSHGAQTDTTGKTMVEELAHLSERDRGVLVSSFESSTDKTIQGLGRRLDQLTQVSKGTSGDMADMSGALSGLDIGATIQMKLQSIMAVVSRPLNELTGIERMAAESITGMSGTQIEQYQALARISQGNYDILKQAAEHPPTDPAEMEAMIKDQDERFGAHITKQGEIVTESGAQVADSMGLLTATSEHSGDQLAEEVDENLYVAQEALDETMTITDLLQNDISVWLRSIYEDFGLPVVDILSDIASSTIFSLTGMGSGLTKAQREEQRATKKTLTQGAREARISSRTEGRTIAELEMKGAGRTPEEEAALGTARTRKSAADQTATAVSDILNQMSSGDFSATRGIENVTDYAYGPGGQKKAVGTAQVETTLTGEEILDQIQKRAGAEPVTPATEEQAALVTDPITTTIDASTAVTRDEHAETRSTMETIGDEANAHLTKVMTKDRKVGDMIAKSNLPDAIVAAQVKQQFASLAFASGLDADKAAEALDTYFETGTLTPELQAAITGSGGFEEGSGLAGSLASLGIMPGARGAATAGRVHRFPTEATEESGTSPDITPEVDDFIYRGNGVRGTITPIDTGDVLVGSKEGGALDRATGGGGNVHISIYGGDERRVFDVVKRVLRESGVGAGRVTTRA